MQVPELEMNSMKHSITQRAHRGCYSNRRGILRTDALVGAVVRREARAMPVLLAAEV
jgi:succinate dehydrogenase flavin-adding protein (antitoxin of CptAB toxin-antitoxin module)